MPYSGTNWKDFPDTSTPINAARLNNMEAGITAAYTQGTGGLLNADIGGAAAIAYSKLNLALSILNSDISASAAIAISKLAGYPTDATKFLRGDGTWVVPPAGAFALIADSTAGGAVASFDFSGISASYKHLLLWMEARGDTAAAVTASLMRFNADASAIYYRQLIQGVAAAVTAAEGLTVTSAPLVDMAAATSLGNSSGSMICFLPNYASAAAIKTIIAVGGNQSAGGSGGLSAQLVYATYFSFSVINEVNVRPSAGNWLANSRATLYGLS